MTTRFDTEVWICDVQESIICKGGGGTTTTSTQNNDPWSGQQQYLTTGFERAETDVLNRPLEYFPDDTVIPFSPETEAALGRQSARAWEGSPLLAGAQGYTGDVLGGDFFNTPTIRGDFLDPSTNPFFSGVSDAVLSQVQPQVASTFARAGRTGGSPLHAEALGRGVSRGMAPFLFGEYGRERGLQESAFGRERAAQEGAAARAPGLAREDYFDIERLGDVGAAREGKSEERLADQIARFNFAQEEPTNRLAQYTNLIRGNYGGTSTSSSTSRQSANTGMQAAGLIMSLAGAGK